MLLFIDTSDFEIGILALLSQDFLASKQWKNNRSDLLVPKIQELFKESGAQISNLKKIAVVSGPGPFSRIRSGVAVANALGYALGINVIAVPATEEIDISKLFVEKGTKMVKPVYASEPHITKSKRKHLKI